MTCSELDLKAYFFNELAGEERRQAESHVSACAACREELERLRLTRSALAALADEEPPRRIAFVSDGVFEPNWWQRLWRSGPQLGFVSAALLAAAILVHAFVAADQTERVAQLERRMELQRQTDLAAMADYARVINARVAVFQRAANDMAGGLR